MSELDNIKGRIDAEYYKGEYLILEEKINSIGSIKLKNINIKLDCSAFYPSITDYYNFEFEGVPFLRVNEIQKGLVTINSGTAFLPQFVLENNQSTIAKAYPGDIVIAKGGNTLAKLGLVTDDYPYYALSRDLILVRTNELTEMNKYFLWVFLHSKYGQALLWRTASQTGQPHLTLPSIGEIGIPRFSNHFEEKFESLYKLSIKYNNNALVAYQRAENLLLKEVGLADYSPSKESINTKSYKESFLSSGRLDAEYYQPKFEQVIEHITKQKHDKLKNLVSIKKSIEPGSSVYAKEGLPFLRVSDFNKFDIKEPEKKLSDDFCKENVKTIKKLMPQKGTILFSKDGTVGIAYMLREKKELITSGAILHLTVKNTEKVIPEYLTLVLNSKLVQMQAERDAGGSIILHWRVNEIEEVVIPIINYSKQMEIAVMLDECFNLKLQSETLLNLSLKAIELAINKGENEAVKLIEENITNNGIGIN